MPYRSVFKIFVEVQVKVRVPRVFTQHHNSLSTTGDHDVRGAMMIATRTSGECINVVHSGATRLQENSFSSFIHRRLVIGIPASHPMTSTWNSLSAVESAENSISARPNLSSLPCIMVSQIISESMEMAHGPRRSGRTA